MLPGTVARIAQVPQKTESAQQRRRRITFFRLSATRLSVQSASLGSPVAQKGKGRTSRPANLGKLRSDLNNRPHTIRFATPSNIEPHYFSCAFATTKIFQTD